MHAHQSAAYCPRPAEMRYRHFLGVKWSQVQILSARHTKMISGLRRRDSDRTKRLDAGSIWGPRVPREQFPSVSEGLPVGGQVMLVVLSANDICYISIAIGIPTSVATGVQMLTSWPGVSIEMIKL